MSDGSQMQVGARGVLHDLRAAKQYNGQEVVLKRWMEVKERWKCRLPDNTRLNVRPSNIKPCKGTATSSNPTKVEALLSAATNSPERPPVAALPSPAVQVRPSVAVLPPPASPVKPPVPALPLLISQMKPSDAAQPPQGSPVNVPAAKPFAANATPSSIASSALLTKSPRTTLPPAAVSVLDSPLVKRVRRGGLSAEVYADMWRLNLRTQHDIEAGNVEVKHFLFHEQQQHSVEPSAGTSIAGVLSTKPADGVAPTLGAQPNAIAIDTCTASEANAERIAAKGTAERPCVTHWKKCKSRRCSCGKCIPSFGMPGGSATHCKECKEQGMVDVINRRCSCGKCIPCFGMPGGSATHCKERKEQGMVDFRDGGFEQGWAKTVFRSFGATWVLWVLDEEADSYPGASSEWIAGGLFFF